MRLLYTLRYGSAAGNCGGDLRLFFTTQNGSDWQANPGMWLPPNNQAETLTLASGDVVTFSLYPVNNGMPGLLYLFGSIAVKTAGGQELAAQPVGQAEGNFTPGHPAVAVWKGRSQGTVSGVTWDVGFDMAVPWDGTSADASGQWWAVWY